MIDQVNTEMVKVVAWLNANKLTLNMKKTHFIVFKAAKKHIASSKSVLINNHPITQVNTTIFLGIIIHSSLSWRDHILTIKGKVSRGIGILSKARRYFITMSLSKPVTTHSSTHTYITVMRFGAVHTQIIWTP